MGTTPIRRTGLLLATAGIVATLLAGCTASGGVDDLPTPTAPPSLSAAARHAIHEAQVQAAQANSPTAPATVLPDTIENWPAVDHGAEPHADGTASETSTGVFRYVVASGDGYDAIASRFGLCMVDVTADTSGGLLQPGDVHVLERHADDPDQHAGAVCDPQG
jgi:hypothetical protein